MRDRSRHAWLRPALLTLCIIVIAASIELVNGRTLLSKSGHIQLWVGAVNSSENSQQILDWYSFSHVLHGFLFYGILHLIGRKRWSLGACLVLAILLEASWEVTENTNFIINRYRANTISLDYYGDSVLNSVCDMLCCLTGFFMAALLPVWFIVSLAVLFEAGMAYAIRDNLGISIIMLLHPIEAIKHWQMALPP